MTTFSDIHLTTETAHLTGVDFGMRMGRAGTPWAGLAVTEAPLGGRASTEVAADRNLHALAARCAG
jgi:hypothetical protein